MQLGDLGGRYPAQLSGGQRQRVALARALAIDPSVLLLDEPFGALDAKVRKDLRRWLRELQRRLKLTTVFVTHDQEEALEIADRVVVMSTGRIEQIGTPLEVYDRPATPFVMEFLGDVNRMSAANGTPVGQGGGRAGGDLRPTARCRHRAATPGGRHAGARGDRARCCFVRGAGVQGGNGTHRQRRARVEAQISRARLEETGVCTRATPCSSKRSRGST